MIGLDTNILIDLMVSSSEYHLRTTKNFKKITDSFCITPVNIGECLRILTHKKIFASPLELNIACAHLKSLIENLQIYILEESTDWWEELVEIHKTLTDLRGNEIFDARIALCLKSHNVKKFFTRNSDFKKYRFIKSFYDLT